MPGNALAKSKIMYELRFFFDFGSGICLWSKNEAARVEYGYPVDHQKLPISENTKRWLDHLIAWYDIGLDWDNVPNQNELWTLKEAQNFETAVAKGYQLLLHDLSADLFKVFNETGSESPEARD